MLHLAVARSAGASPAGAGAPAWLGASELARWASLAGAAREAFVASRALLRSVLATATGTDVDAWQASAQAGAAPVVTLRRPRGDRADVAPTASVSHRLGWVAAAVAVAPDGPCRVGVDVECARPARTDPSGRAVLMLAADELARWRALPEAAREEALLCAWAAKEAFFKAAPAEAAPWDFRRLCAMPSDPLHANVRLWTSTPARVHVALCSDDAPALAAAVLQAPADVAFDASSSWQVSRVG